MWVLPHWLPFNCLYVRVLIYLPSLVDSGMISLLLIFLTILFSFCFAVKL